MKFHSALVTAALLASSATAFTASSPRSAMTTSLYSTVQEKAAAVAKSANEPSHDDGNDPAMLLSSIEEISELKYRQLQKHLSARKLDTAGTLTELRNRLRHAMTDAVEEVESAAESVKETTVELTSQQLDQALEASGITFADESDPDFDYKNLIQQILKKSEMGHWKFATRKLKQLSRRFGKDKGVPADVYSTVLSACADDRLHAARAAEPARKIMEQMAEAGYAVDLAVANSCIDNCIGNDPDGTHEGFGGIDCALAMLAALDDTSEVEATVYSKLIGAMAKEGSLDDAVELLRFLVMDKSGTPSLQLFAEVATACARSNNIDDARKVVTVLTYIKAAGYELDNIAATEDGRNVLAAGVVATERINNLPLGLRLLTAASRVDLEDGVRGDALVASHTSSATQRAATLLHRRAVAKATQDEGWKLAVKLLELMIQRELTPSPNVWRNVVTCCAKAEKSRKATALLLDWVKFAESGKAEKPPLRVFNTVINACEICGEEELTLSVLDSMRETHKTDGNLITFNIALKRLAKQGNTHACEGIIIGMLQSGIEPSVVSFTTAIAACVKEPKKSDLVVEWLKRMQMRRVSPNTITYNTALASCLDGTLESTKRASEIAASFLEDIQKQLDSGNLMRDQYTNLTPNFYTKTLAREMMEQLKTNWENGDIDREKAEKTLQVPFLSLVNFSDTELGELSRRQEQFILAGVTISEEEAEQQEGAAADEDEEELEFSVAVNTHRAAAV